MEAANTQVLFFQHIKNLLPSHIALVDAIAELLNISNDSAYRRIRGEKPVSLEELQKLSTHFKVSMDQFLHLQTDAFIFTGRITNESDFDFEQWLASVLQQLEMIRSFPSKHTYFRAKEIPFFYYFLIPEISAFKIFFWMKTILHYENLKGMKFSLKNDYSKFEAIGKKVTESYMLIPCTEIWNVENFTSTIGQVEFYKMAGMFQNDKEALVILDKLDELLNHLQKQAELGVKFMYSQSPGQQAGSFTLFNNEVALGDNTLLAELGPVRVTFINHSIINFISTRDEGFNAYTKDALENLMRKSTQISVVNERDRMMFFNRVREKISAARRKLFP